MTNPTLILITLVFFSINSCNPGMDNQKDKIFSTGQVIIEGEIGDYTGDVKTGRLTHFNALFRSADYEVFSIDSLGKFKLSFELIMPTYTNIISIGHRVSSLYLVPGSNYSLKINEKGDFLLDGANAFLNQQLNDLRYKVRSNFKGHDLERMNLARSDSVHYNEYSAFLKMGSDKKVDFINNYSDSLKIDPSVRDLIVIDAIYEQAWARILQRMIYFEDGRVVFKDDLPNNFYEDILSNFPINHIEAAASRKYMDYLSNLLSSIIERSRKDTSTVIDYYSKNSSFSNREIRLINRAFLGDTTVIRSAEFQQLTKENRSELSKIFRRYTLEYLLETIPEFKPGFGRDALISQCIDKYYLQDSYLSMSNANWNKIESLIDHQEIYKMLRKLDNIHKAQLDKTLNQEANLLDPILASNSEEFYHQLFDQYKGKYVYIDFWATWCGPCKSEMAVSKQLQKNYEGKDIVFLYLCCASDKTSWTNYIKSEQLSGAHYFINHDEQNYLSSFFEIRGYPTYAVLDPKGNLIDNNPPRPSSQNINNYLDDLLR